MKFKARDKVKLVKAVRNSNRKFEKGLEGSVVGRKFEDSMVAVLLDSDILICEDSDLKLIKEDNKMNEFKEQMNKAFRALVIMEKEWDNLDSHERATVEQVAQETGFDELGDFEEVVSRFKDFYLQMQRTEVIDGYQVYIDDFDRLHIIKGNINYVAMQLIDLKDAVRGEHVEIPIQTVLKITEWYIEEV